MTTPTDADFRRAYESFGRNHDSQRAELLVKLPPAPERRRRWNAPWLSWRKLPTCAGLAAVMLLVAAAAAFLFLSRPDRVYGLEGLHQRLLAVRSIHIKGWIYHKTTTKFGEAMLRFPTESFHERPYRQYHTHYGFSDDGEKLIRLTRSVTVGDESRTMFIDHDGKRAIIAPTDKLNAELMVESMFQQSLVEQLAEGTPDDFSPAGAERVRGVMCDVYEQIDPEGESMRFRKKLWLNPQNGLPMKLAVFSIEPGEDEPFFEWSEISINGDAPAEMFSFKVPEGYRKIDSTGETATNTVQPAGSCSVGGHSLSAWTSLNIDDRAVLLCWWQRSDGDDGPQWFHLSPQFSLQGATLRPCDEITLRTDDFEGARWRWSLVVPQDGLEVGKESLAVKMTAPGRRGVGTMGTLPMVFEEARLAKLVEEVQRRTLPAGAAESEIWTLAELREKLAAR